MAQGGLFSKIKDVFKKRVIDDEFYEELIEGLILSDVDFETSENIVEGAKKFIKESGNKTKVGILDALSKSIEEVLGEGSSPSNDYPKATLVFGVNGAGKTTTIAKLAHLHIQAGRSVLLVAADTFRSAASEQLESWANVVGCEILTSTNGQDPSSVIYDCLKKGNSKKYDVILIDTAGRVHNKENLMKELDKMHRIAQKNKGIYSLEKLLVLDGQNGTNSLLQAKSFSEIVPVDGLIMTKTEAMAKGGAIISAKIKTGLDIFYLGIGEGIDDIKPFNKTDFAKSMFSDINLED